MLFQKYNQIMQKPEEHRNKWAFGLTVAFSLLIFFSFAFYKGYLNLGGSRAVLSAEKKESQTANVISADKVPSPLSGTTQTFGAAFSEIGKQYNLFKDSISSVLVPFFTGIEVYERK